MRLTVAMKVPLSKSSMLGSAELDESGTTPNQKRST
jgi:hypothetical protein